MESKQLHRFALSDLIGLAALVVAVAAVFVSAYTAYLERRHQRLSVIPRLDVSFYYNSTGAGWQLSNDGLGPAHIVWVEALLDGVPQPDWPAVLAAMRIKSTAPYTFTVPTIDSLRNVGPATLLWADDPTLAQELVDAEPRFNLRICYCSLYEECWVMSRGKEHRRPVSSCDPTPEVLFRAPPT